MSLQPRSWRETTSSVIFALALTCLLAATLFVIVAINPKDAIYGNLPWYYAGFCALATPILLFLSRWLDGQEAQSTAAPRSSGR